MKDWADKKAAALLPCQRDRGWAARCLEGHDADCPIHLRSCVATALRVAQDNGKRSVNGASMTEWVIRKTKLTRLARYEALADKVRLLGILDHERRGVLTCQSCCADAAQLRDLLANLPSPAERRGGVIRG